MASWFRCQCGELLHKNLFAEANLALVVDEAFLDQDHSGKTADELVGGLVLKSRRLLNCGTCGRVQIIDETAARPDETYVRETKSTPKRRGSSGDSPVLLSPESAPQLLAPLKGARARLRHYSASHDRATLEVSVSPEQRWYVNLVFCTEISARTAFVFERPQLRLQSDGQLEFKAEGFRVLCAECSIQTFDPDV